MTARGPSTGTPAPQLHTHVVFFNVTERPSGETRALQPRELYKSQQYVTAVYRSELADAPHGAGLRDRARRQRAAGDPRLHGGVPRGLQSAPPAD